jgi:tRNA nucleotidyltransferase (CCA-adding enzyme)
MVKDKFPVSIPEPILAIGQKLIKKKFAAYLVGGSVRDWLLGREVKDWDIATSAKPEEIIKLFPDSYYNNKFGTVGVKIDSGVVEITTFRQESHYSDARHPDEVIFAKRIGDDLKRRDFTVNALALDFSNLLDNNPAKLLVGVEQLKKTITFEQSLSPGQENFGPGIEGKKRNLLNIEEIPQLGFGGYPKFSVVKAKIKGQLTILDQFSGLADLEQGLIRAVGDPNQRFQEDALRLIRAVRFAVQLGYKIEKNTAAAIKVNAQLLRKISRERIREELSKILLSNWPAEGIVMLRKLGLLGEIIPVLEEGRGVAQDWHHIYTVYKHSVLSLKFCFSNELAPRLAALLHDAAKPRVKAANEQGKATFYFHEVQGARIARKVLAELRFPAQVIDDVSHLIRHHMFNYDPAQHNEGTVRRMLHRVGGNAWMDKLLIIRIADRLGSGCKKGEVFKLRKLKYLIEKVSQDPVSLKQLKINGKDLMSKLKIKPGPALGSILNILLAAAIADPQINQKKKLLELVEGLWLAEQKQPGYLVQEERKAEEYLEGKRQSQDITLQEKHRVREK